MSIEQPTFGQEQGGIYPDFADLSVNDTPDVQGFATSYSDDSVNQYGVKPGLTTELVDQTDVQ